MARQGLNATLSYQYGGQRRAYRVRANLIIHGMKVLFDESASRTRRAFYPHRLTSAQFTMGVQLKGEDEYRSFSSWLASYADYILNINLDVDEFPSMVISVPSQNFLRKGVPLSGYEWGDRVGVMVWDLNVVFESAGEPLDTKAIPLSRVEGYSSTANRDVKFFYPTGTQLSGNEAPPDGTYTQVFTVGDMIAAASADLAATSLAARTTTEIKDDMNSGGPV